MKRHLSRAYKDVALRCKERPQYLCHICECRCVRLRLFVRFTHTASKHTHTHTCVRCINNLRLKHLKLHFIAFACIKRCSFIRQNDSPVTAEVWSTVNGTGGWRRCRRQQLVVLNLKQTAHSPFISVILLCNTVIFIASSIHKFVPVAYMQINLIYLNDFNESYVYF